MAATCISVSVVECLIDRAEEDIKSTNARLIKAKAAKVALGQELIKATTDFVAETITRLVRNTKLAEITDQLVKIEFRIIDYTGHLSALEKRCVTFRESIRLHDCEAVLLNHMEQREPGPSRDETAKKLDETRAAMRIADEKTMAILARGTTCVIVPQESAKVTATVHVSTQPAPVATKPMFASSPGIVNTPYKHTIAATTGWLRYMNVVDCPGANAADTRLMNACDSDSLDETCAAIDAGATDVDAGLGYACRAGRVNRVNHMLNLGAKDLQLGLACACVGGHQRVIRILIAQGAVVDANMIVFVGQLSNGMIEEIAFEGSRVKVSHDALNRLSCIGSTAGIKSHNYLQGVKGG
jgi:hypothetical protein